MYEVAAALNRVLDVRRGAGDARPGYTREGFSQRSLRASGKSVYGLATSYG